ncbi:MULTISPECIES: beta-(1-6) glucans synthase [unclassified Afipia]|uniref:glycoside hydrolase family 17 protein n=1 Tax=unclassified Afipia TaxID=2642050 RepID=UPI00040F1339|nr:MULTISPECIES: beta-(1-6) glucans synthase [unclassified Afipia]
MIIAPEQIAQDLAQLAKVTDCIRTYSVGNGLDQVPELAQKAGLKVMLGIWIGTNRVDNRTQMETAIGLAKKYPGVVGAVIVGNEVLLRGEMTAADLTANIRYVKSKVGAIQVTYADVWEFWLKNRDVYDAVDFVTIHILPYWEDFPIRARHAANHVDAIRKRMAVAFPNKEILIGETGWPSAGRMREGALPSRANQARVVSEILQLARQEKFRVNLIEAYDQPWKRMWEGTVGGHWGLFDADGARDLKYPAGEPITNFPRAKIYAVAGMIFSALVFGVALLTLRRRPWSPHLSSWVTVAICATAGGALLGVAYDKLIVESLGLGGWTVGILLFGAAVLSPLIVANTVMYGRSLPTFMELIGPREYRTGSRMQTILGIVLLITTVLATQTALGFVFDPRYRDFQFAALTMAVVPFVLLTALNRPAKGTRPITESVFAGALALSAIYIGFNEGPANWQSLWTCGLYLLLALTLSRARVAQTQE